MKKNPPQKKPLKAASPIKAAKPAKPAKPAKAAKAAKPAKAAKAAKAAKGVKQGRGIESDGFPIVGIGASAGGLAAFETFFSGMPAVGDPGMAFVLVQHLAPDHKSILTDLIRRYTRMRVFEVEDGMQVQRNCAYIIPPNCDMAFLNGALQLLEPAAPRGQRMPIDFFFRSLAQDQRERSIGIVLSGTGSDGTLGIRAIKGEGGMVMAQSPATTEYDGMPRNAIATGLVDFELSPPEMPAKLIAYVASTVSQKHNKSENVVSSPENSLKKMFILLRSRTGHDFSFYKPSTIHRRISRRMAVHQIATHDDYVKYLQQTPVEVDALFRDLLIGVTNFFRDPEVFEVLKSEVVPKLFSQKRDSGPIRVWSAGCSTGEEAYSLAILLQEGMEQRKTSCLIQIFATDIDSHAIATARAGIYPASIANDLSAERLARFFTAEPGDGSYRIHKGIRDMVIFSEQNVVKDPPFSKLDLISCRNLMIYMGNRLQQRLIPLFHYALNPGATLLLGTSETIGDFNNLFSTLDAKRKIYQRKEDFAGMQRAALSRFMPHASSVEVAMSQRPGYKSAYPVKQPLREITEQALLMQVVQVGALVNAQGDIFYLHGRTGLYLEPSPGESGINNILKMAREGLRSELVVALHKAVTLPEAVHHAVVQVKTNGHFTGVKLTVCPVAGAVVTLNDEPLYLVILEEAPNSAAGVGHAADAFEDAMDMDGRIAELKQELQAKEEYLQTSNEELVSSNEELKSSNEELQSVNEEMQSTNEELETSKEELQSVNEELSTVNGELQSKMHDLSRNINDTENLLAGTGVATVFVDHELRILRFTSTATRIINLIQTDVGRPVGHIVSNLVGYTALVEDVQAMLDSLISREIEVQTTDGQWYLMRLMPYRTRDNVIEGAVITFVNITEMIQVKEALRKNNEILRLAVVGRDAHDAITVQDLEGRILAWNPKAVQMYGWSESEALQMHVHDRIPSELHMGALTTLRQLSQAEILEPYRTQRLTKEGSVVEVSIISTALVNEHGQMYAVATTERAVPASTPPTKPKPSNPLLP